MAHLRDSFPHYNLKERRLRVKFKWSKTPTSLKWTILWLIVTARSVATTWVMMTANLQAVHRALPLIQMMTATIINSKSLVNRPSSQTMNLKRSNNKSLRSKTPRKEYSSSWRNSMIGATSNTRWWILPTIIRTEFGMFILICTLIKYLCL